MITLCSTSPNLSFADGHNGSKLANYPCGKATFSRICCAKLYPVLQAIPGKRFAMFLQLLSWFAWGGVAASPGGGAS
jgi:hypothetical protein